MQVIKLNECGYEESVLGFSLSYNSTVERAKQLLPKFAFGKSGERKFLESISVWIDVIAPRFFWSEFDTYRVGTSKQSESTMHTITKRLLGNDDFEYPLEGDMLWEINNLINWYGDKSNDDNDRREYLLAIKNVLPEGFLQRRVVSTNYRVIQNIYDQRKNHRLPQWRYFLQNMLEQVEHPEFIIRDYKKGDEQTKMG